MRRLLRGELALLAVLALLVVGISTQFLTQRLDAHEHHVYLTSVSTRMSGWATRNGLTPAAGADCPGDQECFLSASTVATLRPQAAGMLRQIVGSNRHIETTCFSDSRELVGGCQLITEHAGVGVSMTLSYRSHEVAGHYVHDPGTAVGLTVLS